MVEFAIVVVLLIMLLYGIITYGLILAAQATVTQAAADAARAGLTVGSATAVSVAETQAGTDVGWMNKGTCGTSGTAITCNAVEETCPSNSLETCLKVTVIYNYSSNPLFPELPGLGIITPSTISSTNVLQLN
jgi:Flp pilus assembly protein TadG